MKSGLVTESVTVTDADALDRSSTARIPFSVWSDARVYFQDHPRARLCDVWEVYPFGVSTRRFRFTRKQVCDRFREEV